MEIGFHAPQLACFGSFVLWRFGIHMAVGESLHRATVQKWGSYCSAGLQWMRTPCGPVGKRAVQVSPHSLCNQDAWSAQDCLGSAPLILHLCLESGCSSLCSSLSTLSTSSVHFVHDDERLLPFFGPRRHELYPVQYFEGKETTPCPEIQGSDLPLK